MPLEPKHNTHEQKYKNEMLITCVWAESERCIMDGKDLFSDVKNNTVRSFPPGALTTLILPKAFIDQTNQANDTWFF